MINFKIIYTLSVESYDLYDELSFYELIDYCRKKEIHEDEIEYLRIDELTEYLLENIEDDELFINRYKDLMNPLALKEDLFTYEILYNKPDFGFSEIKFIGTLNSNDFVKFIEFYSVGSINETMGILDVGELYHAFNVSGDQFNCVEDCYVSILYKNEYPEEIMEKFEEIIKLAIEDSMLTDDFINNTIKETLGENKYNK